MELGFKKQFGTTWRVGWSYIEKKFGRSPYVLWQTVLGNSKYFTFRLLIKKMFTPTLKWANLKFKNIYFLGIFFLENENIAACAPCVRATKLADFCNWTPKNIRDGQQCIQSLHPPAECQFFFFKKPSTLVLYTHRAMGKHFLLV